LRQLANDLRETMHAAPGIGITAPHIGVFLRVVVLDLGANDGARTYVNPEIGWASSEMILHREGSVSLSGVNDEVQRHGRIRISYQDIDGNARSEESDGLRAVCHQHEIDQLDGGTVSISFGELLSSAADGPITARRQPPLTRKRSAAGSSDASALLSLDCSHHKSAISYSGRISISLGPGMGLGQRFTQATASSMSLTSQSQKPATSSRVCAKGPSMTVRLGPSKATRLPCEDGLRPSAVTKMPASRSSSLNLPIASIISASSAVWRKPFSLSSVAFTSTITRIVCLLLEPAID
jgi:peptide deformylase